MPTCVKVQLKQVSVRNPFDTENTVMGIIYEARKHIKVNMEHGEGTGTPVPGFLEHSEAAGEKKIVVEIEEGEKVCKQRRRE